MPDSGPVQLIESPRFGDTRGWFSEVYSDRAFAARGIDCRFVQDNQSLSRPAFTLRGLHFQALPHAQAKLIQCLRGRIFDVAVDIRTGSPTFGAWTGAELSAENGRQLFVPTGFAHGFLTLEPDSHVAYKVSSGWDRDAERSIRWDDPAIAVAWPLPPDASPVLSEKDADARPLGDRDFGFAYEGRPLRTLEV